MKLAWSSRTVGLCGTERPHYVARVPVDAAVVLDAEYDRFEWVVADEAPERCLPDLIRVIAVPGSTVPTNATAAVAPENGCLVRTSSSSGLDGRQSVQVWSARCRLVECSKDSR